MKPTRVPAAPGRGSSGVPLRDRLTDVGDVFGETALNACLRAGADPAQAPTEQIRPRRATEILARQLAAGGLSFVRVPTLEEESLRDLVRAREDVRDDLSRASSAQQVLVVLRPARHPQRRVDADAEASALDRSADLRPCIGTDDVR